MLNNQSENPNYRAKIVQLSNGKKHSNADKLMCWNIDFQNVITNLDYKDGDVVVYFPVECTINKDLISYIDGFEDTTKNNNPEYKGFFNKHARVRAISLRGEKSQGFVLKSSIFENWLKLDLTTMHDYIGQEFDSVMIGHNNISICRKYVPVTQSKGTQPNKGKQPVSRISRLVENQFRLHNDTSNLRKNIDKIYPDDIISIHYKKHGTSFVVGNVLCNKKLTWYEKLIKKLGINVSSTEYDIIYSSRRVVKNQYETRGATSYYEEDIWGIVKEEIKDKIPKGITLYGEIVGFLPNGGEIQKGYDYGCKPNEHNTYIYRITFTNENGDVFEFTDKQIEEFCKKYDLLYSDTFFYYGKARHYYNDVIIDLQLWREGLLRYLEEQYNEKDCLMCTNKVPEEGIIVRVEKLYEYEAYKLKSARFLEWETKQLDSEETNIEDNA
jgi:hypothetical protein